MNHGLLMMGGVGSRFGADRPKQYIEIENKPVFIYILEGLLNIASIEDIVVVCHPDWLEHTQTQINTFIKTDKPVYLTEGGATRSESVKNGLTYLRNIAADDDIVLIHDATHPYVDEEGTNKVIEAVKQHGAATLGACQYDTCYRMDENGMLQEVLPRQYLVSGASPEAFTFKIINDIYQNASKEELDSMTSAGAIALHYHIAMKVVPANLLNLKITYPKDMELFRHLHSSYFFKA